MKGQGDTVEIIVRDFTGRKIESFKVNGKDNHAFGRVLKLIRDKYGFSPIIETRTIKDDFFDF